MTSTGYQRPEASIIGQSKKNLEKSPVWRVAEVTINLKVPFLLTTACFTSEKRMSVNSDLS